MEPKEKKLKNFTKESPLSTNLEDQLLKNPNLGLQDAFKKFRNKKMKKMRHRQKIKKKAKINRSLPNFKEKLRQKFIETALTYTGTPYAKRYHEPGSKLFNSKIFLDCCALIRRVMWDL